MQDSIYKFMKVGLIHFMAYPQVMKGEGPILETLQKIAEDDFFTAVEVSWIKDVKVREKAKKTIGSESFNRCLWCSTPFIGKKIKS